MRYTIDDVSKTENQNRLMSTDELMALPPSLELAVACNALGVSKATGYRLVRANAFPCPVVRLGRAIRVPKIGLLRVLGLDPADHTSPAGA